MNKIHLIWIPIALIIGLVVGFLLTSGFQSYFYENYPTIRCIYLMDENMNIEEGLFTNQLITKESMRKAIEYRCAQESIPDLDKNLNVEDIFVMRDEINE